MVSRKESSRRGQPRLVGYTGVRNALSGVVNAYLRDLEALDSAASLTEPCKLIAGHLRAGNLTGAYKAVAAIPQLQESQALCLASAQLVALLRKYPYPAGCLEGVNPREKAQTRFFAAETRCRRVNYRFRHRKWWPHMAIMEDARRWIVHVLGETPDFESIFSKCDFPNGASVGIHGNATNTGRKLLASRLTVTPACAALALASLWTNVQAREALLATPIVCLDPDVFRQELSARLEYTSHNKVAFVPKTAETDRSIAVEPTLNGYVQKGIGTEMVDRLRRAGIDLRDRTRNQRLAREGSLPVPNPYVTIDLSMASDTLATEVVKWLLPPEWFSLLDEARSPRYVLGDCSPARYEKFCSMGNGFCFPLESLIFGALAYAAGRAVGTVDFSVFGDDIIVRQSAALLLIELLNVFGFKTNKSKTFIVGPFRESCGADWLEGKDVRPAILDASLTSFTEVCAFHNSLLRSPGLESQTANLRAELLRFSQGLLRPGREPGDTAFSVPLEVAVSSPNVRWVGRLKDGSGIWQWRWRELAADPVPDSSMPSLVEWYGVIRGASSAQPYTLRYSTRRKLRPVQRPYSDAYSEGFPTAQYQDYYLGLS